MILKSGQNLALTAMILAATMPVGGPVMAAPTATADVEVLAGPCASCHGPGGVSPGEIPSIAGRDSGDLRDRMLAYRAAGSDTTATIMPRLMRGYSPEEIAQLADYFAGLAP